MLPDLTALMHQCAPTVGITTMQAIIRTESGGQPWILGDNTAGLVYRPATKADAVATAQALIAEGHSVDLGLGQINSHNLRALHLSVGQVLDPCTNLAAAAAVLAAGYQRATGQYGQGQKALLAAVSAYNTGSLVNGFGNGYVQRVVANAGKPVSLTVPSLAAGTVLRGRRGAVRIEAHGVVSPYASPLDAWAKSRAARPAAADPRTSPLEAPGFVRVAAARD